jgi:8-oxo-dGTP diphosphatase
VDKSVQEIYGNRVRVRACGICCIGDQLLMINHTGLTKGSFWAPPGGGVDFGISAEETLVRELREETGLEVEPDLFLFATERVRLPLHAVELFFSVQLVGGTLRVGHDPEMGSADQIIKEVRFMTFEEIDGLPSEEKHGAFGLVPGSGRIRELNGYFRI